MICFKPKNDAMNLELNLDIKLYYCGTGDCENNFSWGPGIKDHYKLHFIHSGSGILKVGDESFMLSKGHGFLISPDILTSYKPSEEDPWNYSWVAFNGMNAENYMNRANLGPHNSIFHISSEDAVSTCINDIFSSVDSEKTMDLKALSSFYQLLSILIDTQGIEKTSQKQQDSYVKAAIEFIDTNYSRKITIEEVARYVGINRKYLSRLFSELLNVSPQNYLVQFRLQKAVELLHASTLSIHEISTSVGYDDPFLFSKVFKKYKGCSPKSYRALSA